MINNEHLKTGIDFGLEILKKIKEKVENDFPVTGRIPIDEFVLEGIHPKEKVLYKEVPPGVDWSHAANKKRMNSAGGQLGLAATPPHKGELRYVVDYYSEIFKQLKHTQVKLGKEVVAQDILAKNPDVLIVATGAEPIIPMIPGLAMKGLAGEPSQVQELYTFGDAKEPRTIRNAIAEGFALAYRI